MGALTMVCAVGAANADNFGKVYYDRKTDQLVVTMIYRGTNPNHQFTLKWGSCQTIKRFSLADLPCSRPASVTLRTAPRFMYTLTIPG